MKGSGMNWADRTPSDGYHCAICYGEIPESSPELMTIRVSHASTPLFQELFMHRRCLVSVLDDRIPLGEVFEAT